MRITKKKLVGVTAVAAVVALGAGTAFAYWSGGGTAAGNTTLGTMSATNATIILDNTVPLYPGGSVPVSSATFTNTNVFDVNVVGFGTPVFTITGQPIAGTCDTGWFHLVPAPPASGVTGITVPAGGSFPLVNPGYTVSMDYSGDNQDACQGATIEVNVAVIAVQV